jgi:hypothetical protein
MLLATRASRGSALAVALAVGAFAACGETRRPIGDECLRGDDCLSGVCSARTCVAAPPLVNGSGAAPPDELPLVPIVEGGAAASDAARDAPGEGG